MCINILRSRLRLAFSLFHIGIICFYRYSSNAGQQAFYTLDTFDASNIAFAEKFENITDAD